MAKLLSRFGLGAVVVTGVAGGLIFAAFEMACGRDAPCALRPRPCRSE